MHGVFGMPYRQLVGDLLNLLPPSYLLNGRGANTEYNLNFAVRAGHRHQQDAANVAQKKFGELRRLACSINILGYHQWTPCAANGTLEARRTSKEACDDR
jgi:hypothetical protein